MTPRLDIDKLIRDWRFAWFVILLPVALFLPALPIDETRYLSVAWEMRLHGDFLLLHLNGAPYSDKGPLLFWLINVAWLLTGPGVWIVRVGVLAVSLASLLLFERLVVRLGAGTAEGTAALARRATIMLAGIIYFALFSSAIMFDVLLSACVLIALHGVVDLDRQRWGRGIAVFAAGLGLGLLVKGPVVLLDAGIVALLAPWWSDTARSAKARWYGSVLLGMLGGIAIALVWALAAYGLQGFWDAIVVRQTVGRVAKSFAHQRPVWWYFMVVPLMLLPWTVAVRAPWRDWRDAFLARSKAVRFAVAWFIPAFVAFCFVSGKQPHYLLPLLPALALYLANVLDAPGARLRGRWFGALLVLAGLALAALPYLSAHADAIATMRRLIDAGTLTRSSLAVFAGVWPWWGLAAAALGVMLSWRAQATATRLALASAAAAAIAMLAVAQGVGPYVDANVKVAAERIGQFQQRGAPIAHLGWHHGLFEFAGRLTEPLEKVSFAQLRAWCEAHPDGEIVTFYSKYPITAQPDLDLPYRFGHIYFWRAADILTMPPPAPRVDDEDEAPDD
jgi:4-amino-4-deoxy-L-arabinose transferase-like glycosyltransferase